MILLCLTVAGLLTFAFGGLGLSISIAVGEHFDL